MCIGIVTHKQNIVFGVVEAMFQMDIKQSTGEHTAVGGDDSGAGNIKKFLMMLMIFL